MRVGRHGGWALLLAGGLLLTACPKGGRVKALPEVELGPHPIRDLLGRHPHQPEGGEVACTAQDEVYRLTGVARPVSADVLEGKVPSAERDLKPLVFQRFAETWLSPLLLSSFGFGPYEVGTLCTASAGYLVMVRGEKVDPAMRDRLRMMGYLPHGEVGGVPMYSLQPGSTLPWRLQWPLAAFDEGTLLLAASEDVLQEALTRPLPDAPLGAEESVRRELLRALGDQVSVSLLGPSMTAALIDEVPQERQPDPAWNAAALGVQPLPEKGLTMTAVVRFANDDQAVRGAAFLPIWTRSNKSSVMDALFSDLWPEPTVEIRGALVIARYTVPEGFDPHELVLQRDLGFLGLQGGDL